MGILERISEIEKEISRTQKNKGKVSPLYTMHYSYFLKHDIHKLEKNKLRKLIHASKCHNHS